MAKSSKSETRSEMRRVLSSLDPRWLKAASHELSEQLKLLIQSLEFDVRHVLAWTSFFPGEADLSELISDQLESRKVYLPRVLEDGSMTFISIARDWETSMEAGNFGIPEPAVDYGVTYDPEWAEETVILVPGMAFDEEGNRLGRGKGVYDTFLRKPGMNHAIKIGICWSLQILHSVPCEFHDVTMDWICHERGFKEIYPAGGLP